MKKLLSGDVELVVYSRDPRVAPPRASSLRVFPDPGAFHEDPPPFDLLCSFLLADGHVYGYRYSGLGDVVAADYEVALLSRDYPPGPPVPAGGRLFNASTRSRCVDKFLIT